MTTGSAAQHTLSAQDYRFLQDFVHRQSGIVVEPEKEYLLISRLLPVAERHGAATVAGLCAVLRKAPQGSVAREVVEAMTTHETLFFRDAGVFQAISRHLVAQWRDREPGQEVAIWSAAASSGQELYSVAMLLHEEGLAHHRLRLLGTDISESVLTRARAGLYSAVEVNRGLPPAYRERYFVRQGAQWQVRPEIRRLTSFQQFDLRRPMGAFGQFDLILCRNVLIYFDLATKRGILRGLRQALHPGGCLILGAAENLLGLSDEFRAQKLPHATLHWAR
jgi:chemotaxis protein methyltransferase CheR